MGEASVWSAGSWRSAPCCLGLVHTERRCRFERRRLDQPLGGGTAQGLAAGAKPWTDLLCRAATPPHAEPAEPGEQAILAASVCR